MKLELNNVGIVKEETKLLKQKHFNVIFRPLPIIKACVKGIFGKFFPSIYKIFIKLHFHTEMMKKLRVKVHHK